MVKHLISQTVTHDSLWTHFLMPKISVKFHWGHPKWGVKYTWGMKNLRLLTNNLLHLRNITRQQSAIRGKSCRKCLPPLPHFATESNYHNLVSSNGELKNVCTSMEM